MKWVVESTTRNLVVRLALSLAGLLWAVTAHAQGAAPDKPGIRAVTAFVTLDKDNYAARMDEAAQFLAQAKTALNQAGFPGANGRVTTQPFPQYIKGMTREQAIASVGYPLTSENVSLDAPMWKIWRSSHGEYDLNFKPNGRIGSITGDDDVTSQVVYHPDK